jgi:hypothetical protein
MLHALSALALLCGTASADYIIKQQYTDAACTNAFLALSIQPSGCIAAPPGAPFGPSVVECTSPTSANLKNYVPGDATCSGVALAPSTVNAVDGNRSLLASWACSLGSDRGERCAVLALYTLALPRTSRSCSLPFANPRSPRSVLEAHLRHWAAALNVHCRWPRHKQSSCSGLLWGLPHLQRLSAHVH